MGTANTQMDVVAICAGALDEAETSRTPIAPLTERFPSLTLQDAYAIQQKNINARSARGERIVGHKIGLTAETMQKLFGVDEPDYGHIMESMLHPESSVLDMSRLIDPQIEVEPAFVLGRDLRGPDLTIEDVLDATDHITVCFEIIDSRIADWRIKLEDTVADNGSSALVTMGTTKIKPREFDLRGLETVLEVDGKVVETGDTTAILGHPANGVAWLANKISQFGVGLKEGDIVLPGTCTRSFRIGGCKHARGSIARLGEVSLDLTGAPTVSR